MNSIDLIRDNLQKSRDRVLARIDEMEGHALVFPTPNGGAHTLWTLGHLAYIEGLVTRRFMLGEQNPLAAWEEPFDGAGVASDASFYPSFREALAQCREMREATLTRLDSFSEPDLDRSSAECPEGFEEMFGNYRRCFQFLSDHWYMHRGQLADSRRAAGIDRMWF